MAFTSFYFSKTHFGIIVKFPCFLPKLLPKASPIVQKAIGAKESDHSVGENK